jgi:cytochrome c oxidase assembly protein subunit 15
MVRTYRVVALAALLFTLAVILWGAFVRITGAGAGCGNHWPTCNGEVIPTHAATHTIIEFTHRATTAAAVVLVLAELVLAFLAFPAGHRARLFAALSVGFMATEAAIGAGLVLFEHVAGDKSIARGYWISTHLANTFALVACMALATLASDAAPSDERAPTSPRGSWSDDAPRARIIATFAAMSIGAVVVGITGAIAALGDTLFPARSLAEGIRADFSPSAHAFLMLRTLHPFGAILLALGGLVVASASARSAHRQVRTWASRLGLAIVCQVIAGVVNLLLLAPPIMQIVHLLLADAVWISIISLAWSVLTRRDATTSAPAIAPQPAISR